MWRNPQRTINSVKPKQRITKARQSENENNYSDEDEYDKDSEDTRMKIRLITDNGSKRYHIPPSHSRPYPILPADFKAEDVADLKTPVEINEEYDSTEQYRELIDGVINNKEMYDLTNPILKKALYELMIKRVKDMEEDNWKYEGGL